MADRIVVEACWQGKLCLVVTSNFEERIATHQCRLEGGVRLLLFITAGMVVERKPCVRGKMSENAMRRSKATACML